MNRVGEFEKVSYEEFRIAMHMEFPHYTNENVREMYDKISGASDKDWSEIAEQYTDGVHPDQ